MSDLIPLSAVLDARGSGATTAASPTSPEPTNELDKDAFLQLLVAQLRYQNPLSPTDPSQFMAQSAQFTMVEKLTEMATHTARQRLTSETMVATSTLGREITWLDAEGVEQTGVVERTSFRITGPVLIVGAEEVTLDQLLGVADAPAPQPARASQPDPATTTDPATGTDPAPTTDPVPTPDPTTAVTDGTQAQEA